MQRIALITLITLSSVLSACSLQRPPSDQTLIGSWQGAREEEGKCQFLSWNTKFQPDGRFSITFFKDAQRTLPIQTEHGTWSAGNGRSELKTDGVRTPEVYEYKVIDAQTIHYINTVKNSSADCQEDYEFTEHRIRG
jgi:hypothetical protein